MLWSNLLTITLTFGFLWKLNATIQPGYLDFDNLPETNFSCEEKVIGGYYADIETGCQMFHVCTIGQKGEITDIKFLCLNGTVFDQETRVCERIDEVDCSKSESFFNLNLELYGNNNSPIGGIESECDNCDLESGQFFNEDDEEYEEEFDQRIVSSTTSTIRTTTTTTTTSTTPKPTTTTIRTTTTPLPTTRFHRITYRPTNYEIAQVRPVLTQPAYRPSLSHFPISNQQNSKQSIAALVAFQNAFNKYNFQQTPTKRPISNGYETSRPSIRFHEILEQQTARDSQPNQFTSFSSHHFPLTTTTTTTKRPSSSTPIPPSFHNYHHFESADAKFTHGFSSTSSTSSSNHNLHKIPFTYQFRPIKSSSPSPFALHSLDNSVQHQQISTKSLPSVSIVTSSTSTSVSSVRSSPSQPQQNLTKLHIFYDEYDIDEDIDGDDDTYYQHDDIKKIRVKRNSDDLKRTKRFRNHRYPDENINEHHKNHRYNIETSTYSNHKYDGSAELKTDLKADNISINSDKIDEKEIKKNEFLENLLGSIDLDDSERKRLGKLFKNNENEMETELRQAADEENKFGDFLEKLENKIEETLKVNRLNDQQSTLDFSFGIENKKDPLEENINKRKKRDTNNRRSKIRKFDENIDDVEYMESDKKPETINRRLSSPGIDTEKFDSGRKRKPQTDIRPVTEIIEDDLTTTGYRQRTSNNRIRSGTIDSTANTRLQTRFEYNNGNRTMSKITARPTQNRRMENIKSVPSGRRISSRIGTRPVYEELIEQSSSSTNMQENFQKMRTIIEENLRRNLTNLSKRRQRTRVRVLPSSTATYHLSSALPTITTTTTTEIPNINLGVRELSPPFSNVQPDPNFSCDDKTAGGLYADVEADCYGFFICTQIKDNRLEKSHFWCGTGTRFNQKSRTCQAELLVNCSLSKRFYYLNNRHQIFPSLESDEDRLRGNFESQKVLG